MDKNLFSSVRFRQILNDLKRRPEDAARELGISLNKINKILKSEINLDIKITSFDNSRYSTCFTYIG